MKNGVKPGKVHPLVRCDYPNCVTTAKWENRGVTQHDSSKPPKTFCYCDYHAREIRNEPRLNKGSWHKIYPNDSGQPEQA